MQARSCWYVRGSGSMREGRADDAGVTENARVGGAEVQVEPSDKVGHVIGKFNHEKSAPPSAPPPRI